MVMLGEGWDPSFTSQLIVGNLNLPFTAAIPGKVELINCIEAFGSIFVEAARHQFKRLLTGSRDGVSHVEWNPPSGGENEDGLYRPYKR